METLVPGVSIWPVPFVEALGRFKRLFSATWELIPEAFRDAMLAYSHSNPACVCLCYEMDLRLEADGPALRPMLCLAPGQISQTTNPHSPYQFVFTFSAPYVELQSESSVVSVIGHELAHFYHHATEKYSSNKQIEEANTRLLTAEWGFIEPGYGTGLAGGADFREWRKAIDAWQSNWNIGKRLTQNNLFTESGWPQL